jgi:hypothetical protein
MENNGMNIIEFLFLTHILLISFIGGSMNCFYSETVKRKIIEELENDGMSGGIEHIQHRLSPTPIFLAAGIIMLIISFFLALYILGAGTRSILNSMAAIPIIILNTFLQYRIVHYLNGAHRKIRSGERKTMLGTIGTAIMLGSVHEAVFKICLIVIFVLHIATFLKIVF